MFLVTLTVAFDLGATILTVRFGLAQTFLAVMAMLKAARLSVDGYASADEADLACERIFLSFTSGMIDVEEAKRQASSK